MDPETHKEIVEIKKDIRELRASQDAEIQHDRDKYIKLLDEALSGPDGKTAQILLLVDGFRSRKDIQDITKIPQATCWRKLDRLLSKEVIFPLEESKNGSPVYQQSRWFKKLRLEEYVKDTYHIKNNQKETSTETENAESTTEQNQNS